MALCSHLLPGTGWEEGSCSSFLDPEGSQPRGGPVLTARHSLRHEIGAVLFISPVMLSSGLWPTKNIVLILYTSPQQLCVQKGQKYFVLILFAIPQTLVLGAFLRLMPVLVANNIIIFPITTTSITPFLLAHIHSFLFELLTASTSPAESKRSGYN